MTERVKPISAAWARRVIQSATPEKIEELANKDRWWTEPILWLVLDRVEILSAGSAVEGLRAAKAASKLGGRVPFPGSDAKAELLGVLGSAYRRNTDYAMAKRCYDEAMAIKGVSSSRRALNQQRYSVLLLGLGKSDEALALIEDVVSTTSTPSSRAGALVTRASIYVVGYGDYKAAMRDSGAALSLADPVRDSVIFICAARNLAYLVTRLGGSLDRLKEAALLVSGARAVLAQQTKGKGGSSYQYWHYPMAMLVWVEGRILARLGSHRQAIRCLREARVRLMKAGQVEDVLVVAVDEIEVLLDAQEGEKARAVCAYSLERASEYGLRRQAEAFEDLLGWMEKRAAGRGLESALSSVKSSLRAARD